MSERPRTALVVTPALEGYGSDLQMLQSVHGLREAGWDVVVAATTSGRLSRPLADVGASTMLIDFPVLRRANASGAGLVALALAVARALPRLVGAIRAVQPDVLYVNTVTLPWWLFAGRLARVPTVCHVHEAEARDSRIVRRAFSLPLLLAQLVIANSHTTEETLLDVVPQLRRKIRRIYNGVDGPIKEPSAPVLGSKTRLVVVGRLSPRKAPHTALEAAALLRGRGVDVSLDLCGTAVDGMERFHDQLLERAEQPDLKGTVTFAGYASPVWPALDRADIVIAPSLGESFGNAVVEGQLARRPVVATALQGHLETIRDGETGLLVPAEDPPALVSALVKLISDREFALRLADQGRRSALQRFSPQTYRQEICSALDQLTKN